MWWNGTWNPAAMIVMGIGMLAFWAIVVWAIVYVVRTTAGGHGPAGPTARDILDERFARGELDDEEYRRRRDALGS